MSEKTFYIASKVGDDGLVKLVRWLMEELRARGWVNLCDWTSVEIGKPYKKDERTSFLARGMAKSALNANLFILVLKEGVKPAGSLIEFGLALSRVIDSDENKRIYILNSGDPQSVFFCVDDHRLRSVGSAEQLLLDLKNDPFPRVN